MSDTRRAVRLAALQLAGLALARRERGRVRPGAPLPGSGGPRTLLIRPDHVGDVLLATPAARVLRAALPDAEIDWLVGPWTAEMAARAGGMGEVLTLEFPGFTRRPKRSPVEPYRLLFQEAARLRARQYDAALVLRPDHWWGALLAAAAGIPRRFGYAVAECQPFLTDLLPPPTGHAVEANQALAGLAARAFGGRLEAADGILTPCYPVSDNDAAWARGAAPSPQPPPPCAGEGEMTAHSPVPHPRGGQQPRPLVALHPGSGAPVKNWLPARWAQVVASLRESHQAEVVLTGGPGERDLIETIAAGVDPHPRTLVGETTLGQLAALFARCDLVIGGDSGPLHLAAAVGTPTVRLYGPTSIVEFGPWPPGEGHVALAAGLPCQPCRDLIAPPCGAVELPACLRAITAESIVEAAGQVLASPGSRVACAETSRCGAEL